MAVTDAVDGYTGGLQRKAQGNNNQPNITGY